MGHIGIFSDQSGAEALEVVLRHALGCGGTERIRNAHAMCKSKVGSVAGPEHISIVRDPGGTQIERQRNLCLVSEQAQNELNINPHVVVVHRHIV